MRLAWGALGAALALSGCLLDGDGNDTVVDIEDVCVHFCECEGAIGDGLDACTADCVAQVSGLLSPQQMECLLEASCLELQANAGGCLDDNGGT